jgi:uncharacterized protein YjbI with pentapeptide repeats
MIATAVDTLYSDILLGGDLSNTNLPGADLTLWANLLGATLFRADLTDAIGANFSASLFQRKTRKS